MLTMTIAYFRVNQDMAVQYIIYMPIPLPKLKFVKLRVLIWHTQ